MPRVSLTYLLTYLLTYHIKFLRVVSRSREISIETFIETLTEFFSVRKFLKFYITTDTMPVPTFQNLFQKAVNFY